MKPSLVFFVLMQTVTILTTLGCDAASKPKDAPPVPLLNKDMSSECSHRLPTADLCIRVAYHKVTTRDFFVDMVFWRMDPQTNQPIYLEPPQTLVVKDQSWAFGIDPYMSSMGHGSRFDTDIQMSLLAQSEFFPEADKVYRVGPFDFVMGGPWEIRVVYGQAQPGPMPRSLEWSIYEKVDFPVEVPWFNQ